jgi:DNA-binding CsgD family transcriptional regulator
MDPKINQLVVDLYRAGREVAFANFQAWALTRMHEVLDFDAAWWGRGANRPLMVHQVHLHRCASTLVDDYAPWIAVDFFREAACARPGTTINTSDLMSRKKLVATTIYREFGAKHRVEWSLGTVLIEPVSSLNEFITVWRKDAERPFAETDRAMKQFLMPHLAESYRNSRLLHLLENGRRETASCWALCHPDGILVDAHRRFAGMVRSEWPEWNGAELPAALRQKICAGETFRGRRLTVSARPLSGHLYLEARASNAVDRLSRREREVAHHYAEGRTYAEIAALLGLAPATIRNLISRTFAKLRVSNKAELTRRLRD